MSRSNSVDIVNPAEKFFKWSGSTGKFSFWDKEKEENVEVAIPFKFIVLDTLSTMKGFSDTHQSGFWSNEVRDLSKETLHVYCKVNKKDKKKMASGLYNDIKGHKDITGAKFCQSVYIGVASGGVLKMANIQLTGAALSAWIEFSKVNKIMKGAIEVSGTIDGKKGSTTYKIPVFNAIPLKEELNEAANLLDGELQNYLNAYFTKAAVAAADVTE